MCSALRSNECRGMRYRYIMLCCIFFASIAASCIALQFIQVNLDTSKFFKPWYIEINENNQSEPIFQPLLHDISQKFSVTRVSKLSKCAVILRHSEGRLGNRMFMFASAYGLARTHACLLYVDAWILQELNSSFLIGKTNTISKYQVDNLKNIQQKYTICQFLPELMLPNAIEYLELRGFWQSYGFFSKYLNEIKSLFTFHDHVALSILPFIRSSLTFSRCIQKNDSATYLDGNCSSKPNVPIKRSKDSLLAAGSIFSHIKYLLATSNSTWIGVHIRRGDFWKNAMSSVRYIVDAITYFEGKYSNTIFILASDEKDYCLEHFANRSDVILTPKDFTATQDLAVLSSCQHSIVTAGSYGWWSALLAGGDVYHDVNHLTAICPNCSCSRESYYPPWFIFLSKVS